MRSILGFFREYLCRIVKTTMHENRQKNFNVLREYFLEMLDVSGPSFGCPKRTILYAGPGTDVPRFSE